VTGILLDKNEDAGVAIGMKNIADNMKRMGFLASSA